MTRAEKILEANNGIKVKEKNHEDLTIHCVSIISNSYAYLRYGAPEDLESQAEMLAKDLIEYFGGLGILEIDLSIDLGVRGEYGEFIGLSNATYFKWVKDYMTSYERMEAFKKVKELPPATNKTPMNEAIIAAFERYKKHGHIIDAGNIYYDYLDQLGLVPFTTEEKKELMQVARERLVVGQNPDNFKSLSERNEIKAFINELMSGGAKDRVKSEAKKIGLRY